MSKVPDRLYLDPRCKAGLVHAQPLASVEGETLYLCGKCGNGEPGIPYVKAEVIKVCIQQLLDGLQEPSPSRSYRNLKIQVRAQLQQLLQQLEIST